MKKFIWLLMIVFLVAGCGLAPQKTDAPTMTAAIATVMPKATSTPFPTATELPTPTIVLTFPLSAGTPLPNSSKVITISNLKSLQETLLWSQGPASTTVYSSDHSLVAINTSEWVRIYDTKSRVLVAQIKYIGDVTKFSQDDKYILVNGALYTLGGIKISSFPSQGTISYSDDLKSVAVVKSCTDTGLIFKACESDVYDVDSNKMISGFPGTDPVLSPDGKYVAVRQDKYIYFRRVSDGKQMLQLNPDNYLMDNPAWKYSPDGSRVLVIHQDLFAGINILSLDEGKLLKTIYPNKTNTPNQRVYGAEISNNGLFLATFNDSNITVFEVNTGKVVTTSAFPTDKNFTGVDDNGNLVFSNPVSDFFDINLPVQNIQDLRFGTDSNALNFFTDPHDSTGKQYCTFTNNTDIKCNPQTGFLASDGKFYTATADPEKLTLFVNDEGKQQEVTSINWKNFAPNNISGVQVMGYSAGNDFLVVNLDIGFGSHKALILDIKKQQIAKQWDWDESTITYANLSPDGKYLALKVDGQNYGSVKPSWDEGVFSFEKGWYVWSGGNPDTYLMSISPDSTKMIEMQNRNGTSLLYYYDFIRRELLGNYEMDYCGVNSVAISSDNSFALLGCGGTIQAIDLTNGKTITSIPAFQSSITSITISSDGSRIAAGSSGGFMGIWDLGD